VSRAYFCEATNRDGRPCGNRVPTLPSGVRLRTVCKLHARLRRQERAKLRLADDLKRAGAQIKRAGEGT
jgi:hypothetical protein